MTRIWFENPVKHLNEGSMQAAISRQQSLTKPPGSLGRLEEMAIQFSAWQGTEKPELKAMTIVVFAGDHGIAAEGVSAFPQQVTVEMIKNFSRGGAAISVLAKRLSAEFSVVNMGTANECDDMPHLKNIQISRGTKNFINEPAMTDEQVLRALQSGAEQVSPGADLFIAGEMGIANTSAAAAMACAYLGLPAEELAGRGTGIDDDAYSRKCELINTALTFHSASKLSALDVLRCLGGLEIAGMAGAYLAAAQQGIPCLVDGFISTAAALAAVRINPGVRDWLLFSHRSEEAGHGLILQNMAARPLLDFGMRLGEGSGAALAAPLLVSACALQSEMATFAEANVSSGVG